jgi:hypothetical protein
VEGVREEGAQEVVCFATRRRVLEDPSLNGRLSIPMNDRWKGVGATSKVEARV